MIVKNEEHNLKRLFDSIDGCFDEIHITDTGSTDGTVALAESLGAIVHHFTWIDDFSAARNYSFSHIKTDYVMWLDGDDVLSDKEVFKHFRDHIMVGADIWLANYNYAFKDGVPVCTFVRERIMNVSKKPKWEYFVHEGIIPAEMEGKVVPNFISTWCVNHLRQGQDVIADKSRNLNLFEKNKDSLDSRMRFYYGKELFEADKNKEAVNVLKEAVGLKDLEMHDRVLGIQYLCMAMMKEAETNKTLYPYIKEIASTGLMLTPNRAEFFCFIGDTHLKQGQFKEALPYFGAAKVCKNINDMQGVPSPIFSYNDVYTTYPRLQIARIYAHTGEARKAILEAKECLDLYPGNKEAELIISELEKLEKQANLPDAEQKCEDIVFTCPPMNLYEWDYEIYKTKGIGGSETALVEIANHLKQLLPNRRVIVFNDRKEDKVVNGVEYYSNTRIRQYFEKYEPSLHIAWRHNIGATKAKTYLWNHDLIANNIQDLSFYHKVLCLSEFHKNFVHGVAGVPLNKIELTRNGVNPDRFKDLVINKKHGKIVYSSSPDRGLDHAIKVMDEIVKEVPEAKLHVFYGFGNMERFGMHDQIKYYKDMAQARPYIYLRGNVDQDKLRDEFAEAQVWLYPTNFLETFCITALEALATKAYPVTREYGALQDTLKEAKEQGMATLLPHACETEEEIKAYAKEAVAAIKEEKWKNIQFDVEKHAWKAVAQEWLTQLM